MMGLVDRVVTGDNRWLGGRDGYMEDRDREVTVEVVMTKEAAGDTVVVLMRVIGGQEVQTQDVMEVGIRGGDDFSKRGGDRDDFRRRGDRRDDRNSSYDMLRRIYRN